MWSRSRLATLVRRDGPDPGLLLISWAALALGISRKHGDYTLLALLLVVVGLVTAYLACSGLISVPFRVALAACALVVLDAAWQAGPVNHSRGAWYYLSRCCAIPAAFATLATLRWRRAFGPALALLALTALLRILATPTPPIDVHFLLTDSTRGLIHGMDMYRQSWPGSHGLQNEYPYLPWTSVLLLPAWLLTHEVRVGLWVAVIIAAVALRRLAGTGSGTRVRGSRRAMRTSFLPLLVASYPLFAYQLQQSWTEPLLVALLVLMVLAVERGRPGLAVIALALALASKQHIALLLPLAAFWPAFGWRRTLAATGLGFALVLPWLIAGPRDLWDDAVLLNVHYPVLLRGLDVPALAARHGVVLGFGITVVVVALAYLVTFTRLPRNAAGFAAGSGLVQLSLDVFNKQSFFNHYTLVMGLFAIALVAASRNAPGSAGAGETRQRSVLEDSSI